MKSALTTLSSVRARMQPDAAFRAEISVRDGRIVVLDLFGELDSLSLARLDAALEASLAPRPETIIIDLSRTDFVSGAGYAAIGRCSRQVERLVICCRGHVAQKVLGVLGYRDIAYVDVAVEPATRHGTPAPLVTAWPNH